MSVRVMDRESVRFAYLSKHFPKSVRPRWKKEYWKTKTLVQNQTTEIRAWNAFEKVCGNFLGNEKEGNYTEIVRSKFYHTLLCGVTYHWNFIFCIPIWISFLGARRPSPMNMVKDFIREFPKFKRGTVGSGVQIRWLTTAGNLWDTNWRI
jgi:hypothetical protein